MKNRVRLLVDIHRAFGLRAWQHNKRRDIKYFHESRDSVHYDRRYYRELLGDEVAHEHFRLLFGALVEISKEHRIDLFIMHGSLIGWHWNRRPLPWDVDIDVSGLPHSIEKLERAQGMHGGGRYLLEVNPNWRTRTPQPDNVIDARLIDTCNGLFVDITALSPTKDGRLACKRPHFYEKDDILPLHPTTFLGFSTLRPNHYVAVLEQEYGPEVTTRRSFHGHVFNGSEWVKVGP